MSKCSHYWFHHLGEDSWSRCQPEKETLKLINLVFSLELEEVLEVSVNWYLKVNIFQVQFDHPIPCLDEVGEGMYYYVAPPF